MSSRTKRKHVFIEFLNDDLSPPSANQTIVRIQSTKGNNLHEVLAPARSKFLVSMPRKFRKNVWIKRGNYVLVEPIEEGNKVKGEIGRILTKEHIKHYRRENMWPEEFDEEKKIDDSYDLLANTNRICFDKSASESEEESSDGNES